MKHIPESRFSYDPSLSVENTTIHARSRSLKRAAGEKPILTMLEKYGLMNKQMVREGLRSNSHKTINVSKSLKRMQEMGLVKKYTVFSDDPDLPANDVYILSRKMREKCGIDKAQNPPHDYNMANIPYVYEKLVLCQWHLRVLSNRKGKEIMFNKRVRASTGIVLVPSLVRLKTRFNRLLYVCGVPVCKGRKKEDIASFVAQIAFLNSYFVENRRRFKSYVIVILCESPKQAEDVSMLLQTIKQTKDMFIMYAIDSLVADEEVNPLEMLYVVNKDGSSFSHDMMKLV